MANAQYNRYKTLAAQYRQKGKNNIADALERQAERELEKPAMDINDYNSEALKDKHNNPNEVATPGKQAVQQTDQYQQPNAFGGVEQTPAQPVNNMPTGYYEPDLGADAEQPQLPQGNFGVGGSFADDVQIPEGNFGVGGSFADNSRQGSMIAPVPSEQRMPGNFGVGGSFAEASNSDLGSGAGGAFPAAKAKGYLNNQDDYAALLEILKNGLYTD